MKRKIMIMLLTGALGFQSLTIGAAELLDDGSTAAEVLLPEPSGEDAPAADGQEILGEEPAGEDATAADGQEILGEEPAGEDAPTADGQEILEEESGLQDTAEEAVEELLGSGTEELESGRIRSMDGPEAGATSGKCGASVSWSLKNGTLTITGSGAMYDYDYENYAPWGSSLKTMNSIKAVSVGEGVTTIGARAFIDCGNISKVTLPSTVKSIGESAFEYCSSLSQITLKEGLTSIGESAFRFCASLSSVTIPSSVTDIGGWAFEQCTGLKSIVIPKGVAAVKEGTFRGCESLTGVTLPGTIRTIEGFAFRGCSSLSSLSIPFGVTEIGGYAFMDCSALKSITFPTGVTTLNYGTFFGCGSLSSVGLPYTLKTIYRGAFTDCYSLSEILYTGSSSDWNKVSIDSEYNSSLLYATVKYVEAPPVSWPLEPTVIYRLDDVGSGAFRVYWRAKKGADGYQVRWSRNAAFVKGNKYASYTDRSNVTRSGLVLGATYYVQVRTYQIQDGEKVYARWSGKKAVTLSRTLPGTSISSVGMVSGRIRTTWKAAEEAEGYQLRYADNADFTGAKTSTVAGSLTTFTRGGFARGKRIYISVRTWRTAENGTRYYSPWSRVKTITP